MKELFKARFPFVEKADEDLTDEELLIKLEYEKAYEEKKDEPNNSKKCLTC